jgi:hypothetical protein
MAIALPFRLYKLSALLFFSSFFVITQFVMPLQLIPETIEQADVYFMNSNVHNKDISSMYNYVEENLPTTVALAESTPELVEKLHDLYGKPDVHLSSGPFSCTIFSKRDVKEAYVSKDSVYPICVAHFEDYNLYVIHPAPPFRNELFQNQKEYFDDIKALIDEDEAAGRKFLLVGDFNSTSYSSTFRKNFGDYFQMNMYTWATDSLLTLPIDHAIANFPIQVAKAGKTSSDHNGVFIKL